MTRARLEEAERQVREMASLLKALTPDGWSFIVFLMSEGADGYATYLSTIRREAAIRALEEWIVRQKTGPETSDYVDDTESSCWCCGAKADLVTVRGPHRSVDLCPACIRRDL